MMTTYKLIYGPGVHILLLLSNQLTVFQPETVTMTDYVRLGCFEFLSFILVLVADVCIFFVLIVTSFHSLEGDVDFTVQNGNAYVILFIDD